MPSQTGRVFRDVSQAAPTVAPSAWHVPIVLVAGASPTQPSPAWQGATPVRHASPALRRHWLYRLRTTLQPDRQAAERLGLDGDPAGTYQLAQTGSQILRGQPELMPEPIERPGQDGVLVGEGFQDAPLSDHTSFCRRVACRHHT